MSRRDIVVPADEFDAMCRVVAHANGIRYPSMFETLDKPFLIKALDHLHSLQPILAKPRKDAA